MEQRDIKIRRLKIRGFASLWLLTYNNLRSNTKENARRPKIKFDNVAYDILNVSLNSNSRSRGWCSVIAFFEVESRAALKTDVLHVFVQRSFFKNQRGNGSTPFSQGSANKHCFVWKIPRTLDFTARDFSRKSRQHYSKLMSDQKTPSFHVLSYWWWRAFLLEKGSKSIQSKYWSLVQNKNRSFLAMRFTFTVVTWEHIIKIGVCKINLKKVRLIFKNILLVAILIF